MTEDIGLDSLAAWTDTGRLTLAGALCVCKVRSAEPRADTMRKCIAAVRVSSADAVACVRPVQPTSSQCKTSLQALADCKQLRRPRGLPAVLPWSLLGRRDVLIMKKAWTWCCPHSGH